MQFLRFFSVVAVLVISLAAVGVADEPKVKAKEPPKKGVAFIGSQAGILEVELISLKTYEVVIKVGKIQLVLKPSNIRVQAIQMKTGGYWVYNPNLKPKRHIFLTDDEFKTAVERQMALNLQVQQAQLAMQQIFMQQMLMAQIARRQQQERFWDNALRGLGGFVDLMSGATFSEMTGIPLTGGAPSVSGGEATNPKAATPKKGSPARVQPNPAPVEGEQEKTIVTVYQKNGQPARNRQVKLLFLGPLLSDGFSRSFASDINGTAIVRHLSHAGHQYKVYVDREHDSHGTTGRCPGSGTVGKVTVRLAK